MAKLRAKLISNYMKHLEEHSYLLSWGEAATVLPQVPDGTVNATITSPPYFRRKDYSADGQIGKEHTVEAYIKRLREILSEVYRVTASDGSCFLVVGDTYHDRSLLLVPQRLALCALELGWTIRNNIIWSKLDPPPDSARNRWRESHESIFFLTKRRSGYKFRVDRIRVPYSKTTLRRWGKGQAYGGPKATRIAGPKGQRVKRGKKFALNPLGGLPKDVICTPTASTHHRHYASFPESLVEQFLLATTDEKDIVLDPFTGTSTTGIVAIRNGRYFWGIDVNQEYIKISEHRLRDARPNNSESTLR